MKRAVVIGASSGIGRELALILAGKGYRTGITGRRQELLDEIASSDPDMIKAGCFDITSPDSVMSLERMIEELGGLDLLVFSAGTGYENPELDNALEEETNRLNVTAFTRTMDFAYGYFKARGKGHIASITSVMGLRGSGHAPSYAASKAYQINYLEGLRQKASKERSDIKITELRPGSVDTDMMKGEGHFWIATTERAARYACKAIERGRAVKYITPRWKIIGTLLKSLPRSLYKKT